MTQQKSGQNFRSPCPIATSLDIFGDRWTLIILRDMINGKTKYGEFLQSPERITTNILAARLGTLIQHALVEKQIYQTNPKRYEYLLTKKGKDILPVLQNICVWGNTYYPDTWIAPEHFMEPV